jgi:hypothetical protein
VTFLVCTVGIASSVKLFCILLLINNVAPGLYKSSRTKRPLFFIRLFFQVLPNVFNCILLNHIPYVKENQIYLLGSSGPELNEEVYGSDHTTCNDDVKADVVNAAKNTPFASKADMRMVALFSLHASQYTGYTSNTNLDSILHTNSDKKQGNRSALHDHLKLPVLNWTIWKLHS